MNRSHPLVRRRALALAALLFALAGSVTPAAAEPLSGRGPVFAADTIDTPFTFISRVTVGTLPCDTCAPVVCPGEPVPVMVSGTFRSPCYHFRGLHLLPVLFAPSPYPALAAEFVVDTCGVCTDQPTPFGGSTVLGSFPPGLHSFVLIEYVRRCPDTTVVYAGEPRSITFAVPESCGPPPPPPPIPIDSLIRSTVAFDVVPEKRCPGDSLTLRFTKRCVLACTHLLGLRPARDKAFAAEMEWRPNCREFACFPETLTMPIGRFQAGSYSLFGGLAVHVLDTANPDSIIGVPVTVTFDVPRTCDTTQTPCMFPYLRPGALRTACAVTIPPGGSGSLWLSAVPPVPLGGLQGIIRCSEPFRVVSARPVLQGEHVFTQQDGRGLRYVILMDAGHGIPNAPGPVMQLDLAVDPWAVPGSHGSLLPSVEVASDMNGENVPICQMIPMAAPNVLFGIGLCVSGDPAACDANGDGRTDVRDLVLKTHCFPSPPADLDSVRVCTDCDGDSLFSLEDLFCCASQILRAPLVPRDSVKASGALHVSFDPPQREGDNLLVKVHVTGADGLGAALLRLRYPAERWEASLPILAMRDPTPNSPGWWPIADTNEPGSVQLGGLRMEPVASADLEFQIVMKPTATPLAGDALEVLGADLAAPDGTVHTPMGALPALSLTGQDPTPEPGLPVLSPARPNPFITSTTFSVDLPKTSLLDVGVVDVGGRRVATVAHGVYAAGRQTFTWDGTNVRPGVYFLRLAVDGRVWSRRVALLRNAH
jgi:hypothetical protein